MSTESYEKEVKELRKSFRRGKLRSCESRIQQLKQLSKLIDENKEEIYEALHKDLRKPRTEADFGEVIFSKIELATAINNLKKWMKPEKVKSDLANKNATCEIRKEPYGVALVIGAWNFPFALVIAPLIGAIAAGNCSVIKPSEVSEATAGLLMELIPKYLDNDCFRVVCGGVPETTALLAVRFDNIFYTGNPFVGKIIMAAAAKHLTPVTLELGGKCPVIVDSTCSFDVAAKRIAWGKFVNAGQACLSADYILCIGTEVQKKLTDALKIAVIEFFGEDAQKSDSYCRIVNKRHFQRLNKLLKASESKVVFGNKTDEDDLYISPTILNNVTTSDNIMEDEIFGPIVPMVVVDSADDAIDFVLDRERPLALYSFTNDRSLQERLSNEIQSGGYVINDLLVHYTNNSLPFGGIGNSGMGAYHGKHSFDAFSHSKAYVYKNQSLEMLHSPRYPPYDESSQLVQWAKWAISPNI
ncbi:aldehyde dehydrogenase family 3 member B1-like [Clytia hemisphaerica]|uniref:Aldehyde dehydrogenase n=1 Tax=Clytia hemisphaerica TaxID=252671 RepID=A0A7M5WTG1_9CNID